jgi:hypothetical protein
MNGLIDPMGNLFIERIGIPQKQYCHYDENRACGDSCVKFGEPYEIMNGDSTKTLGIIIKLCTKDQLFFTKFSDERIK